MKTPFFHAAFRAGAQERARFIFCPMTYGSGTGTVNTHTCAVFIPG
jgi:hypothetical protein